MDDRDIIIKIKKIEEETTKINKDISKIETKEETIKKKLNR